MAEQNVGASAPSSVQGSNVPQGADAGGKPPAASNEPPKYYEIKVNGQNRRYTEAEILSRASLAEAGRENLEAASRERKAAGELKQKLSTDFIQGLQEAGFSKEQIRSKFEEWYNREFIEPETMTEAEKYKRELDSLKKEREDEHKARKEAQERAEQEQLDHHTRNQLQQEFIQALETGGLPKNRFTVSRMAFYAKQNLMHGYDAPMDVIVHQVKEERAAIVKAQLEGIDIEGLAELAGEDIIKKLRNFDIGRHKSGQSKNNRTPSTYRANAERPKKSMADVDKFLKEIRLSKR